MLHMFVCEIKIVLVVELKRFLQFFVVNLWRFRNGLRIKLWKRKWSIQILVVSGGKGSFAHFWPLRGAVFYLLKIAVTSRQTEKVVDIMATGMECYRKVKTLEMIKGQRKGLLLKLGIIDVYPEMWTLPGPGAQACAPAWSRFVDWPHPKKRGHRSSIYASHCRIEWSRAMFAGISLLSFLRPSGL